MSEFTVRIGGEPIELPRMLTFEVLERAWPALKAMDATTDIVEKDAARIAFVSALLKTARPELTTAEIKKRLRIHLYDGTGETIGLQGPIAEVLIASGLAQRAEPGKPAPAAPEAPPPARTTT